MTEPLGIGDFVAWDGGCMLIGRAYRATGVHAHYAVQLSFGADDGIRFRPVEQDDWTSYPAVVISSRQPHAMDATPVHPSATILIEPETTAGRALAGKFSQEGISAVPRSMFGAAGAHLFETWSTHRAGQQTAIAAQAVIAELAGAQPGAVVSDERVLKAIAYINANLAEPLTLRTIAAEAYLSPSRFRHLFVAQTGTALRPYVLWRRFLRSWEGIRAGHPVSAAAHAAGFADSAHLTRTSHRMFGFAPSALIVAENRESSPA